MLIGFAFTDGIISWFLLPTRALRNDHKPIEPTRHCNLCGPRQTISWTGLGSYQVLIFLLALLLKCKIIVNSYIKL